MKFTPNKRVATGVAVAALTLAMPIAALAASGPSRITYYCGSITNICQGADHVQFNSFKNNPSYDQHDEYNFMTIRPAGSGAYSDSVNLVAGQEYDVRAFVHNNADPAMVGSDLNKYNAKNTTFKFVMPATVNGSADSTGYISASNANPGTVFDTVTLKSASPVNVSIVGSAKWQNSKGIGAANGATLGDITSGALLGHNALDGVLPGCFDYSGYVNFRIKATAPSTPVTPETVTPSTPTALPQTGGEAAGIAGIAGSGVVGYAAMAYRRSKRALTDAIRNK
jgi:hypothetical protein